MRKNKSGHLHISAAQRLAFRFSLLIAVIILILSVLLVLLMRYNVRMRQDRELIDAMDKIAVIVKESASRQPPRPGMGPAPQRGMPSQPGPGRMPITAELPYYITFSVYKAGGSTILETNDPFLPQLPLTAGRTERYRQKDYFTDGDLNILYCAKQYGTVIPGSFIVQTALNMDQDTAERLLAGLPRILLIALLPLLLVSYWAALLITKGTMKPVEQMTAAARQIGSENLDRRLPVNGSGDELDTLAGTFNDLFARLKRDFDRERQFTADVSHELRTPLSVILGHANLIRRWGKNDPVQLEKSLASLIGEVHSMESIITNLLEISRLESGRQKADLKDIGVEPLFVRLADDTRAWAPDVQFSVSVPDSCTVHADEELLYQSFTIVVSNSIKFAGKHAHIVLSAEQLTGTGTGMPDTVRIIIADDGPGISPDALPHVFERFYRGDPSHNRSAGGSGLGLAIVKSIMSAMGSSVAAESTQKTGTKIIFILPSCNRS